MSHASLPEDLWLQIEPLLPPDEEPGCQGGRPRVLNKTVMRGLFRRSSRPAGRSPQGVWLQWDDLLAATPRLAVDVHLGPIPSPGAVRPA